MNKYFQRQGQTALSDTLYKEHKADVHQVIGSLSQIVGVIPTHVTLRITEQSSSSRTTWRIWRLLRVPSDLGNEYLRITWFLERRYKISLAVFLQLRMGIHSDILPVQWQEPDPVPRCTSLKGTAYKCFSCPCLNLSNGHQ